jgi:hypothetical protein
LFSIASPISRSLIEPFIFIAFSIIDLLASKIFSTGTRAYSTTFSTCFSAASTMLIRGVLSSSTISLTDSLAYLAFLSSVSAYAYLALLPSVSASVTAYSILFSCVSANFIEESLTASTLFLACSSAFFSAGSLKASSIF